MIPLGIADSSPLIVLDRIGRLGLLQDQFQQLVVPPAVASEVGELPSWVAVRAPRDSKAIEIYPPRVHRGESEVILLGLEHAEAVLVIDDLFARKFARLRGLPVIGTVGLVLRAKREGKLKAVAPLLAELNDSGFHVSAALLNEAKRLAGES